MEFISDSLLLSDMGVNGLWVTCMWYVYKHLHNIVFMMNDIYSMRKRENCCGKSFIPCVLLIDHGFIKARSHLVVLWDTRILKKLSILWPTNFEQKFATWQNMFARLVYYQMAMHTDSVGRDQFRETSWVSIWKIVRRGRLSMNLFYELFSRCTPVMI